MRGEGQGCPKPKCLRCVAYRDGDWWTAECLDLGLAVHADRLEEARPALEAAIKAQVEEYLRLRQEGHTPTVLPVPRYRWRCVLWWVGMQLQALRQTSGGLSLSWSETPDHRLSLLGA